MVCTENIYLIDNYFQRANGDIVDIDSVQSEERNIYHVMTEQLSASTKDDKKVMKGDEKYFCRKWSYEGIREIHKRLFLFRNVALEFFLEDGRNFLITMWDLKSRDAVHSRLYAKSSLATTETATGISNTQATGENLGIKLQILFGGSPLQELTDKWCRRELSNFQYLMYLNTLSGRSYNDLTQYPVFPWILSDYESSSLDLNNPKVYRDLSKPMGAQGGDRAAKFRERFEAWDDSENPASHYGVHYTSAMIVCSYLIRMEPFTGQFINLQGGYFDHPDRLFSHIGKSWKSASEQNTNDVRELIPEFFYLSDFLVNSNKFDFGTTQKGEVVGNVGLPPWCKNDPKVFVELHRQALESEYVSSHLHEWIDLIFGFKQQGEEAKKALNLYHYLSYEGAVDMDAIQDPVQKHATIGIINNFGQTPRQLFKKGHPKRNTEGVDSFFRISKNSEYLVPCIQPVRTLPVPVTSVLVHNDKLITVGPSKALQPPTYNRYVEWDLLDDSLRVYGSDAKLYSVHEGLHVGRIVAAAWGDTDTLVTGGSDGIICVWKWITKGKKKDFMLQATMRGHTGRITCLKVCSSWSIILSGGEDQTAILWDLNRFTYIKSLRGHESPVMTSCINETNGNLATFAGTGLWLWDVNGNLICARSCGSGNLENVTCADFMSKGEWSDVEVLATGNKRGQVKVCFGFFSK